MPELIVKRITYACPTCYYKQPFEMTEDAVRFHFREPEFSGMQSGKCPACYIGKNTGIFQKMDSALEKLEGIDLDLMMTVTVASDAELEAKQEYELDERNNFVMEQVDEAEVVLTHPDTGAPIFDAVTKGMKTEFQPIMEPKKRDLTDDELSDLKTQRDANLNALEDVAVQEITP